MAYWFRKRGKVYVCYYKDGRVKTVPRKKLLHLDAEFDDNIANFVANQIAPKYETPKTAKIAPHNLLVDHPGLKQYVADYVAFLASRKKSPNTVRWHQTLLLDYAIPFFLEDPQPVADPAQWPGKSVRLLQWLLDRKIPTSNIIRINVAIRGFYNYLADEGRIQTGVKIRLRNPVAEPDDETPLGRPLAPEEVLEFADATGDLDLRIMALMGYFFSLRPFEIFALTPSDFRAGSLVEQLECSKVLKRYGLYHKLAVHVTRQRTPQGLRPPKAGSKGWVGCFHEDAARLLVATLRLLDPAKPIFRLQNRRLFRRWEDRGIPGIRIKDLRRGSLGYLGHHTPFELANLMKHARHKRSETTLIYMRRPEEALAEWQELDLDA